MAKHQKDKQGGASAPNQNATGQADAADGGETESGQQQDAPKQETKQPETEKVSQAKGTLTEQVQQAAKEAEKAMKHGDHSVLAGIEMRLGELAQFMQQYERTASDEVKAVMKKVQAAL